MNNLASRGQLRASIIRWALFTVPACVLLGYLVGQFASAQSAWFAGMAKPEFGFAFDWFVAVWMVLDALGGFALALVCAAWGARGRGAAVTAFVAQFLVRLAWPLVVFGAQSLMGGLMVIAVLAIIAAIAAVLFWRVRRTAGAMLLPQMAWLLLLALLNYQLLALNPAADGTQADGAIERVRIGN